MKLAELLIEAEVAKLMDILERDCKPFLNAARGNGLLSRGIKDVGPAKQVRLPSDVIVDLHRKIVRKTRKPTHTDDKTHEVLDEWFHENFGIRARSETVFCLGGNGNEAMLGLYGSPYLIFPIGDIKAIWSKKVTDLYVKMRFHDNLFEKSREEILEWMDHQGYTDDDLEGALASDKEVMLACDAYYAIDIEYEKVMKKALGIS